MTCARGSTARGSGSTALDDLDEAVGHSHLILPSPDGLDVGSDPRADGGALAL